MADDNTSVGKISLEIDLTQDLEKEIGNAANKIAKGLQSRIKNTKVEFGTADITKITKSLDEIPKQMTTIMDKTKAIMENATQSMRKSIENNVIKTLQGANSQTFELPSTKQSNVSPTPQLGEGEIIDVPFKEVSSKAESASENYKSTFNKASEDIKNTIDSNLNTTESKASGIIASLKEKLSNLQLPKFDFSNFKMPKFSFPTFQKQEPVLGTEAQRIQLDLLTRQMDFFSERADMARQHINELKAQIAELSKPTGNPILDFINTNQIDKLKETLKAAELEEQKFGDKSDAINGKIMNLSEKMKAAANSTNNNTKAVKGKGNSLDSTGKKGSLFGSIFERLTGIMKSGEASTRSSRSEFDKLGISFSQQARMLGRMLVYMSLYNTVIRGLGDMATYLGSAFMANEQFRGSIMQTRSNLMTAFQPIYNAILPALQALASGLATVSAYVASFMSQLFGTTYQSSFAGASALQSQVGSLDMAEKQAKKTADSLGTVSKSAKNAANGISEAANASKKGLAGFDELNKLGEKTPSSGAGTGTGVTAPITPMANMSPIEAATQGWADKLRNILAGIWQPFKNAWAAEGLNTINAAKYALGGILDLVGSIGKSFYSVWTNGTGTLILENWLRLLQQELKLVGDIGHTFANAWNSGNIGTQIIQSLANALNNILVLETKITQSMRKVWAEEGPAFANLFMQALKATTGVIENVTQKLGWIWDNGGQHAFEGLLKLGAKIGELALYIYTNFVVPFVTWFIDKISPAIAKVLDIVGKLADKASQFINWIMGSGKPVLDTIVTVLGSIWIGIKAYEGAKAIIDVVSAAISLWRDKTILMTAAQAALNLVMSLNPIALVIAAIVGLVAAFTIAYNSSETFRNIVNGAFNAVKNVAISVFNAIKDHIGTVVSAIGGVLLGPLGFALGYVITHFQQVKDTAWYVFSSIYDFVGNICNGIAGFFRSMVNGVISGLNFLIRGLDNLHVPSIDVPGIGQVGGFGFNIGQIPYLAAGGVIDQPTLSVVGEAGKEAVMPLENNTGWINNLAGQIASKIGTNNNVGNDEILDVLKQILKVLSEVNGDLIIKIGESEFARIAIAAINKRRRQTGKTELII